MPLTFISLFAGIGGLDLGLERAGLQCVAQVEIDDYACKVLAKHWPDVARFRDVRTVGAHNLPAADLLCGGFPCQDISNAGKRAGIGGERSGLWGEYARLISELRPRYVLVENVPALLNRGMGTVLGDLARLGYDAEWGMLSACAFGAPHPRERLFVLAYPACRGREPGAGYAPTLEWHDDPGRLMAARAAWPAESGVGRAFDGISAGLDGNRSLTPETHKCILANGDNTLLGGIHDATTTETGAGEVLPILRRAADTTNVRGQARRHECISSAEVLQPNLCKQQEGPNGQRTTLAGAKVPGYRMRGVRGDNEPNNTSYRRQLPEQRSDKLPDTMQEVSRLLECDRDTPALAATRTNAEASLGAWAPGWDNGVPGTAYGVPHRVDRLRGLGNAVVPQVAEYIGACIVAHAAQEIAA